MSTSVAVLDRPETRRETPNPQPPSTPRVAAAVAPAPAARPASAESAPVTQWAEPDLPGPVEKVFLAIGWFLVERFVAVVLFFKTGEFH
ncbi:hypothetical protein [Compostimonas suwonensis]|uniref:Uncharacterized protein n=1 Tax=Compostimonas suwonensis TaxID=1048394 RepID=A0A2M9BZW3_9MICO|nr:hypothetical protein [Compostimonas suwonensis]PJJ63612.1 hypothetical protein CLV54_1282 [Compostimonas suwonensis]